MLGQKCSTERVIRIESASRLEEVLDVERSHNRKASAGRRAHAFPIFFVLFFSFPFLVFYHRCWLLFSAAAGHFFHLHLFIIFFHLLSPFSSEYRHSNPLITYHVLMSTAQRVYHQQPIYQSLCHPCGARGPEGLKSSTRLAAVLLVTQGFRLDMCF